MDELVEGVLSIGARFTPYDWSSVVVDAGSILGDVLSVRLHVALTAEEEKKKKKRHTQ